MTKSPAFQFYAAEWLADMHVTCMSLHEEGAYIRLLAYCWREGYIPNDDQKLLDLLLKGGSTTLEADCLKVVKARFKQDPDDPTKLINPRLDKEREKQIKWREKSSRGGKLSAKSRSKSKTYESIGDDENSLKGGSTTLEAARLNQKATLQSSSSIDIYNNNNARAREHDPNFKPPTLEQVKAYGSPAGVPAFECESFYSHYATQGWYKGNGLPMGGDTWKIKLTEWHKKNRVVDPGKSVEISSARGSPKHFGGRNDKLPQTIQVKQVKL